MAEAKPTSAADLHPAPPRNIAEVIFASATEALGSAVVLWFLGGIAISLASSFAGEMIPSWPPGFAGQRQSGDQSGGQSAAGWPVAQWLGLVLLFSIFFAHSLWVGLHEDGPVPGRRIGRVLSNLRENWFELTVGNAISAWVAILVLGSVPNFSLWRTLSHWLLGIALPGIVAIERFMLGAAASASVSAWFSWYDANQMKLTFWVIYLGGAFDDLGVPNFKTLARWAWRRMQKRKALASPAPVRTD